MSFRELPAGKTLPSCSFAATSRIKRETAERLNAAYGAENSRLIAEHGTAGMCVEQTQTRLGVGQALVSRQHCLTRTVMLPQLSVAHKKVDFDESREHGSSLGRAICFLRRGLACRCFAGVGQTALAKILVEDDGLGDLTHGFATLPAFTLHGLVG
jgi:hypothetical protein